MGVFLGSIPFPGETCSHQPLGRQGRWQGSLCGTPRGLDGSLCPGPDQYLLEVPTGRSACTPRPPRVRNHGSSGAHWAGSPWKGAVGLQTPRPPAPASRPAELHTAHSRLRPSSVAPTISPRKGETSPRPAPVCATRRTEFELNRGTLNCRAGQNPALDCERG